MKIFTIGKKKRKWTQLLVLIRKSRNVCLFESFNGCCVAYGLVQNCDEHWRCETRLKPKLKESKKRMHIFLFCGDMNATLFSFFYLLLYIGKKFGDVYIFKFQYVHSYTSNAQTFFFHRRFIFAFAFALRIPYRFLMHV